MTAWVLIYYVYIGGQNTPLFSPALSTQAECERLKINLDIGDGWTQQRGSCKQILIPK